MKVENGKLKIKVGQTICKTQNKVARRFLYEIFGLFVGAFIGLENEKRYDIINRIYVTTVLRAKYALTDTPKHKFRRDIIMAEKTVRTRYAPSPTGFMHVGNICVLLFMSTSLQNHKTANLFSELKTPTVNALLRVRLMLYMIQ